MNGFVLPNGLATAIVDPTSPIVNGPFGVASGFAYDDPGYFDQLGSYATALATFNYNGRPGVAVIDRSVLAPGSGLVTFFSDRFPIDEFATNANDSVLALNAIACAASLNCTAPVPPSPSLSPNLPEPFSATLLGVGIAVLGLVRHRRV